MGHYVSGISGWGCVSWLSLLSECQNYCPVPQPWALALTWTLDCDLELPAASTLGEHLEVSHLFHAHTFGLQASPRGPAGVGITGWGEEEREGLRAEWPWTLSMTTLLHVDLLTPPRPWAWPHATLPHAFCVQHRTGSAGSSAGRWAEIWLHTRVRAFPWSRLRQRHGRFCTAWAERQQHSLSTLKAFLGSPRLSQYLHSCLTNCGMPQDIQHHHGTGRIPCSVKPPSAHDQCIETSLAQYGKWHGTHGAPQN